MRRCVFVLVAFLASVVAGMGCGAEKSGGTDLDLAKPSTDLAVDPDADLAVDPNADLAIDPNADLAAGPSPDLTGLVVDMKTNPVDLVGRDLVGVPASSHWVMGYYAGYEKNLYPVSAIYWPGLTHVAVAFYLPQANGSLDKTLFLGDATQGQALAKEIVDAAHANGKKAIISIGGTNSQTAFQGATSAANRATFVANLVALLDSTGAAFDGIDIDWEPVDYANDGANMKALIDDLRAAAPSSILTMPVFPQNVNIPDNLGLYATFIDKLDQANIMAYGMAGAYSGWKSWHSSALYHTDSATPTSVSSSVEKYVTAGVPKTKLGVGTGFYGLCYGSPVTAPLQALGGATIKANDGAMSYYNIVTSYMPLGTQHYDTNAKAPYLSFASDSGASGCRYVSYEDPQSIGDKSAYVKAQGLGGAIIWTINQGYFSAASTPAAKNPLLDAYKLGLLD